MNKIHFVGRAGTAFENTTPCGLETTGSAAAKDESYDLSNVTCKKCLKFTKAEKKVKSDQIARGPAPGKKPTELHVGDIFLDRFGIQKVTNFEVARALEDCPKDIPEELALAIIRFRADE